MSGNPSPNTTPPPPGGASSTAMKIGNAFIKQYYKILLTSPSQLNRFYQPDSTVSRGMEPSSPATHSPFSLATTSMNGSDDSPGERVRKAFFEWAGAGLTDEHDDECARVDFEHGAIDAQESINGGILLVVTGHMFLPGKVKSLQFVHTFFLNNNSAPGMKKQFLVKNDILRFLEPVDAEEEEEEEEDIEEQVSFQIEDSPPITVPEMGAPPGIAEEPVVEEPLLVSPPAIEPIPLVPVEYEPSADEEKVEDTDEAAEPIVKHEIVDVEPATEEEKVDVSVSSSGSDSPASSPSSEGKKSKKNRKKKGGKSRSRSNSPRKEEDGKEGTPEKPKGPNTWANLVATGAPKEGGKKGRKGSPKNSRGNKSPSKQDKAPQSQTTKETTKESAPASNSSSNNFYKDRPMRDHNLDHNRSLRRPEATLFIRNIPDETTEEDMRALFEPHGLKTNNKVLSVTLNPARGFCFVDFDGSEGISAIVKEATTSIKKDPRTGRKIKSSFMVHGRVLEVERKVPKQHGGARRYNRSHSPKDGSRYNRGSRGGSSSSGGQRK